MMGEDIPAIRDTSPVTYAPRDGGSMHEIVIPMVPSKNILSGSGWWRNAHNDRVVWRQRVRQAIEGVEAGEYVCDAMFDWGARPMPSMTQHTSVAVAKELGDALSENGVTVRFSSWSTNQSGRGRGETRLVLERV